MADVHDKLTRSFNMSSILGKNTKPELIVRKVLWQNNFRYRLHVKKLPGKPDIVLTRYNVIILIHGCFWHGHSGCKYFKIPATRKAWWSSKITHTKKLDQINKTKLIEQGWKVIEIWECELKPQTMGLTIDSLIRQLKTL
jgi:DNA mismatch endonuclease (patch repair protein)